jgi:hypothetical protein
MPSGLHVIRYVIQLASKETLLRGSFFSTSLECHWTQVDN